MAPVVHGLEQQYAGKVDFLYLNIADAKNDSLKRALGFRSTPHFFLLRPNGESVETMRGVVPFDSLRGAIDRLIARSG